MLGGLFHPGADFPMAVQPCDKRQAGLEEAPVIQVVLNGVQPMHRDRGTALPNSRFDFIGVLARLLVLVHLIAESTDE